MDLRQFIFPFIMAVLTNSLMIVILYGLRKSPYFANLFGVGSMVVLYLFCVLRMYLPIEFPGFQVIVRDSVVYNAVLESLIRRNPSGPGTPGRSLAALMPECWSQHSVQRRSFPFPWLRIPANSYTSSFRQTCLTLRQRAIRSHRRYGYPDR